MEIIHPEKSLVTWWDTLTTAKCRIKDLGVTQSEAMNHIAANYAMQAELSLLVCNTIIILSVVRLAGQVPTCARRELCNQQLGHLIVDSINIFQFTRHMLMIPVTEEEMTQFIEDVVVPLGIVAHQVGIALTADNPVINATKTLLATTTDKQVCLQFPIKVTRAVHRYQEPAPKRIPFHKL